MCNEIRALTMKHDQYLTSIELLKLLKLHHNNCSDYRAAQILGITQQAVSKLMLGQAVMSDETALKLAKEADLNPLMVVFSVIRERAKNP